MFEIILNITFVIIGLYMLYYGGDKLVDGASAIAKSFKLSPLIIGLTIVAFGTSMPEFFVSLISNFKGSSSISIGNVIGSNITNVILVLGSVLTIKPIIMKKDVSLGDSTKIIRRDTPFMFISYILLAMVAIKYNPLGFSASEENPSLINRLEGLILFIILIIYTLFCYFSDKNIEQDDDQEEGIPLKNAVFFLFLGFIFLAIGSDILVRGASYIAKEVFGISERIIGVTIVAIGTSLPELVASLISAKKGQSGIALGNIIGSNIFNILVVLGLTSLITEIKITDANFLIDFCVMIVTSIALFACIILNKLNRIVGISFLILYASYIIYLIIA